MDLIIFSSSLPFGLDHGSISVVPTATYLGFVMGLDTNVAQFTAVESKSASRVVSIAAAGAGPSAALGLFRSRVASLWLYKMQLVAPPSNIDNKWRGYIKQPPPSP